MTDPMAATPGWVDTEMERIFRSLPQSTKPVQDAFAECLARSKQPAAPSDLLGAEFGACHGQLREALAAANVDAAVVAATMQALEALEADIDAES